MKPFVLYCKSYSVDVKRAVRLAKTVQQFNVDKIPFYISAPRADLHLFEEHLSGLEVELIADETIIDANPSLDKEKFAALPGNVSQQVVKSEFWRLNLSEIYLCLDSDACFIRPFHKNDFLWSESVPYTVMDESRDFLEALLLTGKSHVMNDFLREAAQVQHFFDRPGKAYAFGPFPVAWHKAVWESLDTEYLRPRGMNLMDAIQLAPLESRWYGEALIRYRSIPLMPCQPFFKVYHYAWQLDKDRHAHIGAEQLSRLYSGVIYQSAWEREMDWPREGGNWLSRISRRLRRRLGRM
jgi:hypothetical protein